MHSGADPAHHAGRAHEDDILAEDQRAGVAFWSIACEDHIARTGGVEGGLEVWMRATEGVALTA